MKAFYVIGNVSQITVQADSEAEAIAIFEDFYKEKAISVKELFFSIGLLDCRPVSTGWF